MAGPVVRPAEPVRVQRLEHVVEHHRVERHAAVAGAHLDRAWRTGRGSCASRRSRRGASRSRCSRRLATAAPGSPPSRRGRTARRRSPRTSCPPTPARLSRVRISASHASTGCTAPGASTGLPIVTMPATRSGRRMARPRAIRPPRLWPTSVTLLSRRIAIDSSRRSSIAGALRAARVDADVRAVGAVALAPAATPRGGASVQSPAMKPGTSITGSVGTGRPARRRRRPPPRRSVTPTAHARERLPAPGSLPGSARRPAARRNPAEHRKAPSGELHTIDGSGFTSKYLGERRRWVPPTGRRAAHVCRRAPWIRSEHADLR